jgi:cytochrome c oxidase assembly protein subunit 15
MDLFTLLRLLTLAATLAAVPLTWWWVRRRHQGPHARLAALTALTLFLTFDLIVFGAFTRLTDSGLGCPDWPGCYSEASPLAAHQAIVAAEAALPSGPVTRQKAWIEMVHRYLAMVVGALIVTIAGLSWRHRRVLPHGLAWPLATLAWVLVQGLFGKYTVTLKLYPAIVTLHLLGALLLLALLVVQQRAFDGQALALTSTQRRTVWAVLALLVLQITLGGWVSTNYAVLACGEFPRCAAGHWWPEADWANGFTLLRELGRAGQGDFLPAQALVAIHLAHRGFALVAAVGLLGLAAVLWGHADPQVRRHARGLAGLLLLQLITGMGNVVLAWPLAGALCHTAGAAVLLALMVSLLAPSNARSRAASPAEEAHRPFHATLSTPP